MKLSTLYWYIFSENWLDLSPKQREIVSDIEEIIGGVVIANIFKNLSLKSATGREIRLFELSSIERDRLSDNAIIDFRQMFATQIFRELFRVKVTPDDMRQYTPLLVDWCHKQTPQVNRLIEGIFGSGQKANKCREILDV